MQQKGRKESGFFAANRPAAGLSIGALVALSVIASPSLAQTAATVQQSADKPADKIEEIVVTAERRETTLLKVPISISAVTSATLTSRQITDTSALVSQVPGLLVGTQSGQSIVTIRGISAGSQTGGSEASVGQYLDGVYQAQQSFGDLAFLDLGRVEVLRGPQGALYGRNATGGAINYISAAPTDHLYADIKVSAANHDTYRGEAVISGPVTDNLDLRLSGFGENKGGFYTNLYNGEHPDKSTSYGGRFSAHWRPASNVNVDAGILGLRSTNGKYLFETPYPLGPLALALDPALANGYTTAPFKVNINTTPQALNRVVTGHVTVAVDITPNIKVTSLSAYTNTKFHNVQDCDATPADLCTNTQDIRSRSFQQELYANGHSFADRLNWLIGASYYHDSEFIQDYVQLPPPDSTIPFLGLPPGSVNQIAIPSQITKSIALYTDDTFSITPKLRVNFGVRYTSDKKDATLFDGVILPAYVGFSIPLTCDNLKKQASFKNTTFKGGVQYDVSNDVTGYLSVNQGFKAGGFNVSCQSAFLPEKIISYEAGLKASLLDHKLVLTASAFHYVYTDLQVAQLVNTTEVVITNAANAHAYGADLQAQAVLSHELRFDSGISFLDAKYGNYCDSDTISPGAETAPHNCPGNNLAAGIDNGQNLAGRRLNRAPFFTGLFGLTYDKDIDGFGEITARAEVYHSASVPFSPFTAAPGSVGPAYTVVNLFMSYSPEAAKNATLRLFVKNLTNKLYLVNGLANTISDNEIVVYGDPRTYGVQAEVKF